MATRRCFGTRVLSRHYKEKLFKAVTTKSASTSSISDFKVQGICAAPCTPMKSNGDIDLDTIRPYAQHLYDNKITSLFVTGTTGEGMCLTMDERKAVMDTWMAECKQRFTMVIHIGTGNMRESQELASHAEQLGCDAISCVGPTYFKPRTEDDYVEYMKHVAAAAPNTPFYLYDINFVTGIYLDVNEFFTLGNKRIPTLRGTKHTSPEFPSMESCKMNTDGKFQILPGTDVTYLQCLAAGMDVPITMGYLGSPYTRMRDAFNKGNFKTARREQETCVKLANVKRKYGGMFGAFAKVITKLMGVDLGPPRLPQRQFPVEKEANLKKDLDSIRFFEWVK